MVITMREENSSYQLRNNSGFTIVELMVAMAISIAVLAAIYAAYTSQQRTYVVQEQVSEMQQNLRSALHFLSSEIRMAGYDPLNNGSIGITVALPGQLSFSQDTNDDGDTSDAGELVDFGFSPVDDNNRDGIPDIANTAAPLGRQVGGAGGYQAIAENIERIEFNYLDLAGNTTANTNEIRSIQVSILARANNPDREYMSNNDRFISASGAVWTGFNDNFRRRLLVSTIQCRNIGI